MNRMICRKQLWQLIAADFKETVREPGVLFWGIIFPILMSVGLGLAFTQKADIIRKVAVIKSDAPSGTRADSLSRLEEFLDKKTTSSDATVEDQKGYTFTLQNEKLGNTTFIFFKTGWNKAVTWLKQGYVSVVMEEKNGMINYHFDPANSDAKLSYIQLEKLFDKNNAFVKEDDDNIKPLTLQGTRYIDFLIPGLIAMGIMMSAMWGLSYSIIEKRSKKLLRRMVATPMKRSHFLISIMAVRVGMNFVEALLLFIFAVIAFGISIQGSIPALLTVFLAGNVAFAGIAIFISYHTSKTEIGNGLINAVVMPMMILSGVFFSYHNFPDWSIPVIQKLPLTMLADGMRSIFIEGGGFRDIALPSLIMTVTGIVFFATGLKLFKWH
jgi:ABC-2 type transport system permease protein